METKIESTVTKIMEKNEQMLKTEMEKIAQHSEALQGVVDMQTARVGEMVGTLAAQQEATKTKVAEIETTGKDTNNKIDAIMALLQQQSVGARNQMIPQLPMMGQAMHNQYMAMTPNHMSFQQAQNQMTPEQKMSPYNY
eukprot:9535360-Ditylum_brightwellii.AAC.1